MPCYDGPTPEDIARQKAMAGAITAMLCGILKQDPMAAFFANYWCGAHAIVDEEREAGRPYSKRAQEFEKACEDIQIAFNKARGAC